MKIRIFGPCSGVSKEETKYAIEWFSKRLMGPKLTENISIVFVNKKGLYTEAFLEGRTDVIGDEYHPRPRTFRITVDRDSSNRKKKLGVIAHEVVHVKQFARNEMSQYYDENWRGNSSYITKMVDGYWDHPSEIEAYGREAGLVVMYLNHLKEKGIKFSD